MSRRTPAALVLLMLVVSARSATAKPLYITVPRAFSPSEQVALDVAFAGREPVELRVLRPESVERLIGEQANLRRAYVAPSTQHNPGRYLAAGLNALQSPGPFLLSQMSVGLRRALSKALPPRPAQEHRALVRLANGPDKLVAVPPGMQVVRREWLNLDLGGDTDFDVPGFSAWRGGGDFQERQVLLAPLPAGLYLLQLVQGTIEGQVTLVVSEQTVQVKQTDGRVLVRVAGRDQLPVANARVRLFAPGGKGVAASTDKNGEALLDNDEPKVLISVTRGNDVAVVDTDFYSTLAVTPDVFVYTDRPIYKPGDRVHFRGVARQPSTFLAALFRPKSPSVTVRLLGAGGDQPPLTLPLDAFGCFSGSLGVPDAASGVVRVSATLDGHAYESEARVQDDVKPTFHLELLSAEQGVVPGSTLEVKVRARRHAGGIPKQAKYEVFLYREDAGRGGNGSAVTSGSLSTTEGKLSVPARLYSSVAERLRGHDATADPWGAAPLFDKNGEALVRLVVPPLTADEAHDMFRYTLTVRAQDDQRAQAVAQKTFVVSAHAVVAQLAPSAALVKAGAAASLTVRAATIDGGVYGATKGGLTLSLRDGHGKERVLEETGFTTGGDGLFRKVLPTGDVGTLGVVVWLEDKAGKRDTAEARVLIVGEGGEPVIDTPVLLTQALTTAPLDIGEEAELLAMLPDGWGPGHGNRGPLWLTLSGAGIHSTALLDVIGQTKRVRFPIEQRFGSAVHAALAFANASGRWEEQRAAFRIVPKARTLAVQVRAEDAEVRPLAEQTLRLRVCDAAGQGVVAAVSLAVVDQAIYALQGELRPPIADFFYPLGRDNVATFYSMDFQGYGYGEQLARLRQGLLPFQFAAVKTPARRAEERARDTAYWHPNIVTDADGTAQVRFRMPSNQTRWLVSAVAVDASGRFGEALSEFQSRSASSVGLALPQFLRQGDLVSGSVRVAAGAEKATGALSLTITANTALALQSTAAQSAQALSLAKGEERVVPFALETTAIGAGAVSLALAGNGTDIIDSREVPVRPAALDETVRVSAWGGGELALPVDATRLLGPVELTLVPSVVDAALDSLETLLSYPYGCLEQLVATTVPNLALAALLEKQALLGRLDAESQALLALARSRAVQGVDRILALALPGGGFVWFPGSKTPSVALTLIALDGLAYAVDVGVVSKDDAVVRRGSAWLEAQPGPRAASAAGADTSEPDRDTSSRSERAGPRAGMPVALEATRAYVLARLQGGAQAARVRQLLAAVAPTSDLYALALVALAAQAAGIADEPGLKDQLALVVQKSKSGALTEAADWQPGEAFWSYPVRRVGLTAMATHAGAPLVADAELERLRQRFISAVTSAELSTFDRATVILHNLWLIERDSARLGRMIAPTVDLVGGQRADRPALRPRGFGVAASLPVGALAVKVGAFDGVAVLSGRVRTPYAALAPAAEGMRIRRTYHLLRDGGGRALAPEEPVHQGDEVYVELSFDADGGEQWRKARSGYFVVEDGVPAGFVVQQEDQAYRSAPFGLALSPFGLALSTEALVQRAFTPERATFFFSAPAYWSEHSERIGYVMRAQFPGRFQVPPARIADMYAQKVFGRTGAAVLVVAPP